MWSQRNPFIVCSSLVKTDNLDVQYRSKGLQHLHARKMRVVRVVTAWTLRGHCVVTAWSLRGHCVVTAWTLRVRYV